MSPSFTILLVGFLYTILFAGFTVIRREGLSPQFALESVFMTLLFSALGFFFSIHVEPILFLLLTYLTTMRVRILVDLANVISRKSNFILAHRLYNLSSNLMPDKTNALIIEVNKATATLQQGNLDEAVSMYKTILVKADQGYLGIKHKTATHYNLGVAYQRKNLLTLARQEFKTVMQIWPGSIYYRYAEAAIKRIEKPQD